MGTLATLQMQVPRLPVENKTNITRMSTDSSASAVHLSDVRDVTVIFTELLLLLKIYCLFFCGFEAWLKRKHST